MLTLYALEKMERCIIRRHSGRETIRVDNALFRTDKMVSEPAEATRILHFLTAERLYPIELAST